MTFDDVLSGLMRCSLFVLLTSLLVAVVSSVCQGASAGKPPNIVFILADDLGYTDVACFGSGYYETPNIDKLASNGLHYNRFHTTAVCSPTRAALITGRNHHSAGFGVISEQSTGFPGYNSIIGKDKATIGRILQDNGYATSWFGKNHNTPAFQYSEAGPFDQWPCQRGFDRFYGFMDGAMNHWDPFLTEDNHHIPRPDTEEYHLTTDLMDHAVRFVSDQRSVAPEKPFLVYFVPGGTHAPHHPTKEWVQKIHDMHLFDGGYEKLRETIFENQKKLGVIPQSAKMASRATPSKKKKRKVPGKILKADPKDTVDLRKYATPVGNQKQDRKSVV